MDLRKCFVNRRLLCLLIDFIDFHIRFSTRHTKAKMSKCNPLNCTNNLQYYTIFNISIFIILIMLIIKIAYLYSLWKSNISQSLFSWLPKISYRCTLLIYITVRSWFVMHYEQDLCLRSRFSAFMNRFCLYRLWILSSALSYDLLNVSVCLYLSTY